MQKNKRIAFLLFLAASSALLTLWIFRTLPRQGIRIDISPVSSRKSNYHFVPEHWKESKLQELRAGENFKELPFRDQLDLFLKLCDWTHRQWPMSVPDPYPLSNAIDILADIRTGKTGGFCGQYAYVLADVLKAMGFFAVRYVELWSAGGESHFVVEVWSDQFAKWIVLDPAENIYYSFQDSGIPANALDVRLGLPDAGRLVARSASEPRSERGRYKMHLYANLAVSARSDLMRLEKPLTVGDRFATFIFFLDELTDPKAFNGRIPYKLVTRRIDDVYFDCNYVKVESRLDKKQKTVFLTFFTEGSMFNFASFAFSTDQGRNWRHCDNEFSLTVLEKVHSLWVAPVNAFGRFGRPTRVEIDYGD